MYFALYLHFFEFVFVLLVLRYIISFIMYRLWEAVRRQFSAFLSNLIGSWANRGCSRGHHQTFHLLFIYFYFHFLRTYATTIYHPPAVDLIQLNVYA
jgi:hypothetical protein